MRITVKWLDELKVEVKIEEREKILEALRAHNVVDAEQYLRAWVDYVCCDATALQVELLRRNEDAMEFLDSVTEVEG